MPHYAELEWTLERVNRFWDYESQFPGNYFAFNFGGEIVDAVLPHLVGCETIIDFGCGTGFLLDHLLSRGLRAAGADPSERSIAAVREKHADTAGFLGADRPEALIAGGRTFDAAFLVEVVEHLPDDVLTEVLAGVAKLLPPGGLLVVTTPNEERLQDQHVYCAGCDRVFHRWQHVRNWSERSLRERLTQAGFTPERSFTTDFRAAKKKGWWRRLRRAWKRWRKPGRKQPHLCVVARRGP